MLHRFATLLSVCLVTAIGTAPNGLADPAADPNAAPAAATAAPAPPPPGGPGVAPIASGAPGTLTTPDGWQLSIGAKNESLEPVASLTNSPWVAGVPGRRNLRGSGHRIGQDQALRRNAGGRLPDRLRHHPGRHRVHLVGRYHPGRRHPVRERQLLADHLGCPRPSRSRSTSSRHDQHRPGGQEVVQGHQVPGVDHRIPDQDRRLRRPVLHPVLRNVTSSTDNTDDVVTYLGVTRVV